MPINRVIRHVLFGSLEDRAVPYLGLLGGATLPGPGNTWAGHLIGARLVFGFQSRGASQSTQPYNMLNMGSSFRVLLGRRNNG